MSPAEGCTAVPIPGVCTNVEVPDARAEKVDISHEGVHVTTNNEPALYSFEDTIHTNCEEDSGPEGSCKVKSLH